MRPRTRFEHRIVNLSSTLPVLTDDQLRWAKEKLFKHYYFQTKKEKTCMACGRRWLSKDAHLLDSIGGVECPYCYRSLVRLEGKQRTCRHEHYFTVIQTCEELQVVRYFYIKRWSKVLEEAKHFAHEISQHWITPNGKHKVMSAALSSNGFYNRWRFTSMELRVDKDKYYFGDRIYPDAKYIPQLKRNGFKRSFHGCNPVVFISTLLSEPYFETLLKAGQFKALENFNHKERAIKELWSSIKICIRQGYKIDRFTDWIDYVYLLRTFGRDIYSPKYICPENFEREHNRYVGKRRIQREKEALEKQKERLVEDNKIYQEQKKAFLGMTFSNGILDLVIPESVEDILIEGNELHHCVYVNYYYKQKDSLIFSARKEGKRICTIQYSLKNMKVLQARGIQNSDTSYEKDIIELLDKNKRKIKKLAKAI